MLEGKKKLIVILVTIAVHALAGYLALKGISLDPEQLKTLIEGLVIVLGLLNSVVGWYFHKQSGVDIAKANQLNIETIKKVIIADDQKGQVSKDG
jgi:hypothetical protein